MEGTPYNISDAAKILCVEDHALRYWESQLGIEIPRKLLIGFYYEGKMYEYNFARLPLMSRCKWKTKETNKRYIWQIMAQNRTSVIKISCSCQKELMMPLDYETPDATNRPATLFGSDPGLCTLELYRRTPNGLQLIDRLRIENGLCLADGTL